MLKVPLQHRLSGEIRDFPEASQGHIHNPAIELASLSPAACVTARSPASQPGPWAPSSQRSGFRVTKRSPPFGVYSFARAAVTECHNLAGFRSRNVSPHRSRGQTSKIGCPQGCATCRPRGRSRRASLPPPLAPWHLWQPSACDGVTAVITRRTLCV